MLTGREKHLALAYQQFYQIVDMATLREEAVDVNSERPPTMQHSCCNLRLAGSLNPLLQSLLQMATYFALQASFE